MQPETQNKDGFDLDLSSEFIEPMLKESLDRFVLFPIEHSDVWDMYKQHAASFWTAGKLTLLKMLKTGNPYLQMSNTS